MKTLTAFLRKLHLGKALAVFLAGVTLLLTTACNSGNEVGARPNNPPVQMGGANNPHKGGGDGYTQYNTDKRASLPGGVLVAEIKSNASDLLYPNSEATDTKSPDIGPVGEKGQRQLLKDAKTIKAQPQPVLDRSDPNAKILEKTGQAFKDASGFLNDTNKASGQRPELQVDPAQGK